MASVERFNGSLVPAILVIVVTPAVVLNDIPVPASKFPLISPVMVPASIVVASISEAFKSLLLLDNESIILVLANGVARFEVAVKSVPSTEDAPIAPVATISQQLIVELYL